MTEFLIIACVLYLLEYLFIRAGQWRAHRTPRRVPDEWPAISILVAARNEEENIETCLRGLLAQDYPADRMEIIAVNDESEDATESIMRTIAREHPGRLRILSTVMEQSHARGKARAIAQGIDQAGGEIILLTDADCAPPVGWARSVVEHFLPDVDVLGGFTISEAEDYFSAVQQLDWAHLQTIASSALSFNVALGIIGNNFAFRRTAYDAVGGYRTIPFTITEDFALYQAMYNRGMKVVYPCTFDTRMVTRPCATVPEVLRQKQRWARGGMDSSIQGYSVLIFALAMLVAFSIAPFISVWAWIGVWSVKFACDLMVLMPTLRRLKRLRSLKYFLLFELYFIAQVTVVPILLMNPKVVWKGREFRTAGAKVR